MSEDDAANVRPHPVLDALAGEASVVELQGYVGPAERGTLRLHMSLETSTYLVIPEEAVLHVHESESEQGRVHVFVRGTAEVVVVREWTTLAREFGTEKGAARDALARVRRPPFLGGFRSAGLLRDLSSRNACVVDCATEYINCVVGQVLDGIPGEVADDWCSRELARCIRRCRQEPA